MSGWEPLRVVERNAKSTIANLKEKILETNSKLENWVWRIKAKTIVAKSQAKAEDHC